MNTSITFIIALIRLMFCTTSVTNESRQSIYWKGSNDGPHRIKRNGNGMKLHKQHQQSIEQRRLRLWRTQCIFSFMTAWFSTSAYRFLLSRIVNVIRWNEVFVLTFTDASQYDDTVKSRKLNALNGSKQFLISLTLCFLLSELIEFQAQINVPSFKILWNQGMYDNIC